MDFIVTSGDREDYYSGDANYHFDENGLLVVMSEMGKQRTYSPTGWDHLDRDAPGPTAYIM